MLEMFDRLCEKSVFQKCYLTKSIDYNSQISKKWGFHTACRALLQLTDGVTKQEDIAEKTHLSKQSIHNHLKVAKEFGLIRERDNHYYLTDIGDQYMQSCNKNALINQLNEKQIEILKP